MDSASMVLPSTSEPSSVTPLPNGYTHVSSPEYSNEQEDVVMTDVDSELSDPRENHAVANPAAGEASYREPSISEESNSNESENESRNYHNNHSFTSDNPSSPGSGQGIKRKSSTVDELEHMRLNPELYGLRRSHRPRPEPRQPIVDSEDDEDPVAPRVKRRRRNASEQTSKQPSRSVTQSSQSDSEGDEYGGARARAFRAKQRRQLQASSDLRYSSDIPRFSSRNATKVANYNEDSDDAMFEEDAEDVTPNYWITAEEENSPAVDVVLDHRYKESFDQKAHGSKVSKNDCEFYIKWQGKSHYHATWETAETLAKCRSSRRVDNYFRKVMDDFHLNNNPDVPPEDKEKWNLDRERDVEALEDYKRVERIIGRRDGEDGPEYLVKWKRLFYDSCTWESESLIKEIALDDLDTFLDRANMTVTCNKKEMNPATRSPFVPIAASPDFLQYGQLKEFQVTGVNFMAFNWTRNQNVVLADEMGLGKTVQTVAFINWLRRTRQQEGPFIVVVPLSTLPAWAETFDNWTPDVQYVVYNGNEAARNIIREYELLQDANPRKPKFNVLLTTYEYVLLDAAFLSQIPWQFMAVDEAHRLKNRESQLYAKLLEFKSPCRLLITGTPVQNNLAELSALMDFLNPGLVDIEADMDLNSEAASEKLAQLREAIKPLILRRTKSKVETDLPPKTEKIIRVELSDVQLEYYKNILTKNYAALNEGAKGQKQSLLNIMMELKKASNHPFMFPNAEAKLLESSSRREDILRTMITSSGKMMLLDQLLAKLKRDGHRVLIFSQMVKMLDILGEYMEYRGYQYQRLDGTIAAGPRRLAMEHFNAPDSADFAFLLSTRAGGLGINLMTADTVVLFDSDWNPQADLQAMARAHRIGQTKPVSVYRLVSKDTIEEEVLERARNKLLLEFITIQRGLTDKEAYQNKHARAIGEPTGTDDISRILKRRGQKMFEQTDNQKKLEQLDIESVLANAELHQTEQSETLEGDGGEEFLKSFEFVDVKVDELSWDDIIPKEQLEELKADEKRKADERYLAEVIEQNRPRKRLAPGDDLDEREERKAKRQARAQVNAEIADVSDSDESADPKRPLVEKEYRHLLRAFLRYGDIDDREKDVIREARLVGRDKATVKAALREITGKAASLVKEDTERLDALERAGKVPTKKEKKAVLFDLHGVKRLNAYTIVERPVEMRILSEATSTVKDYKSFRVPEASKKADYSCAWGAREDGMLCVGIARHGYGAWPQIRDDAELGLADKFFLEEHRVDKKTERLNAENKSTKSPGAVHLVRRADYLISVLNDKMSNGSSVVAKKAVENHHRTNKKTHHQHRHQHSASVSASPAPPNNNRKFHNRESERPRQHSQTHDIRDSIERANTPRSDLRVKAGPTMDKVRKRSMNNGFHEERPRHRSTSNTTPPNAMEDLFFDPVRHYLVKVSQATKVNFRDKAQRAKELRILIRKIGDFINDTLGRNPVNGLEDRLWHHVADKYWPNSQADANQLKKMYARVVAAEEATTTT